MLLNAELGAYLMTGVGFAIVIPTEEPDFSAL